MVYIYGIMYLGYVQLYNFYFIRNSIKFHISSKFQIELNLSEN